MNNLHNLTKKVSLKIIILYITIIWGWSWGLGYLWFTYIKKISFFDTSIFLLLGPLIVTLIFTLLHRIPIKNIGFIGFKELKQTPNSLMAGMLFIFILMILTLNLNVGLFFLNLPLINPVGTISIYIPFIFLYMSALALLEESAWSGFLYSQLSEKRFIIKNIFISIIWCIWYIPYLFWVLAINSTFQITLLLLIVFIVQLIPMRFVFSWFREKSNNVYWPSFANGITGTANFIIVNLINLSSKNNIIFFVLSTISSLFMVIILYYSFPLIKQN